MRNKSLRNRSHKPRPKDRRTLTRHREEGGRSRRRPRQRSISLSTARQRSRANEINEVASRSRGKAERPAAEATGAAQKGGREEAAEKPRSKLQGNKNPNKAWTAERQSQSDPQRRQEEQHKKE